MITRRFSLFSSGIDWPRVFGCVLTSMLIFVVHPAKVWSADSADEIAVKRVRTGMFVGTDVIRGQIGFRSDSVLSDIRLNAMPALSWGLDLWPEEHLGLFLEGYYGTGVTIEGVLGAEVPLNTMEYHFGGRYRWFLSPRANALAFGVGLSVHGFHQWVQHQRPSVLLDRTIFGPRCTPFITVPVGDGDLWIRSGLVAEYPFFIREEPGDSGRPENFFAWGGNIKIIQTILPRWAIQFHGEYLDRTMEFDGLGTRGAGIQSGETHDRFMRFGFALRFTPESFEDD